MEIDHDDRAHAARRARPAAPAPIHALPPQQAPTPPTALLGAAPFHGRGNGPTRQALLQRLQQTGGNRAVQRLVHGRGRLPVQREDEGPEDESAPPQSALEGTAAVNEAEEAEEAEEYQELQILAGAAAAAKDGGAAETVSATPDSPVQTWRGAAAVAVQRGKPKSRRDIALGRTPGKGTAVGRHVLTRWSSKNKARWVGKGNANFKQVRNWEVLVRNKKGTRVWMPLDENIHMGHKLAAVDFWEEGAKNFATTKPHYKVRYKDFMKAGYKSGFKTKHVRKFMLHHPNYRFEYGPANSSDGAKMKARYKTLPQGVAQWPN